MIKERETSYCGVTLCIDTDTRECWITYGNGNDEYIGQLNPNINQQADDYIENELLPNIKY